MYIYIYSTILLSHKKSEILTLVATYIYIVEYIHTYIYHIHIYTHHLFFIHSSIDGHFGCFHTLAIVNYTTVNNGVCEQV